ncbi:MAG: WD40 repeat domain-containing protein [Isosphaeraceae bacterium]
MVTKLRSRNLWLWLFVLVGVLFGAGSGFWLGTQWKATSTDRPPLRPSSEAPASVRFSGKTAVSTARSAPPLPKRHDYSRLTLRLSLDGPNDTLEALAFSPDGRFLAAAGGHYGEAPEIPPDAEGRGGGYGEIPESGEILIWKTDLFSIFSTIRMSNWAARFVCFSPDSSTIACGSAPRCYAQLWDVASSREIYRLTECSGGEFAFDPTGRYVASCDAIRDARNGKVVHLLKQLSPSKVAFTPSGDKLIYAMGFIDVKTGVKDQRLGNEKGPFSLLSERAVGCSPDGNYVICGYRLRRFPDLQPVDEIGTFRIAKTEMKDVAFSPDSQTVAIAFYDGTVGLWDLSSLRLLNSSRTESGRACSVCFSPDGKYFVVGPLDGKVSIWEAPVR